MLIYIFFKAIYPYTYIFNYSLKTVKKEEKKSTISKLWHCHWLFYKLSVLGLILFILFILATSVSGKNHLDKNINDFNLENYIRSGLIGCEGIRYEDFLPVSAAGIFQSNLAGVGQNRPESGQGSGSRGDFENALGCPVHDEMKLYADRETKTLQNATFYFIR